MGATATRTVRIRFTGDAAGLGKAADDGERHISRWKAGIANVAKAAAVGAAAIGGAFALMAKDSVSAFVESEQAQTRLADAYARFPKLANLNIEALRDFNSELAKKVRFDDDALATGQAVLAQFGLTGTQLRNITPLLADYAAKTGRDLPTAAEVLGKSFLGNTRALKELGISYKATGNQAKDVAAITELLRQQVGGFAEKEGQTAAGRAEILKNQFGEIQEQIGAKLLPVLMALANWTLETLIPAIERLVEWFQVHLGPAIKAVWSWVQSTVFPIVRTLAGLFMTNLVPAVIAVVNWFRENWKWIQVVAVVLAAMAVPILAVTAAMKAWAIVQSIVTTAQLLLNAAMNANPILLIVTLIAGLVAAFVMLWNKSEAFRNFFIGAWEKIKDVVGAVVGWITDRWNGLMNFFSGIPGFFAKIGQGIADGITSGFKAAVNFLIGILNGLISGINLIIRGFNAVNPFGTIPPIPPVPKLARGGFVREGGLAVVGERGREMVSLPAGAQVHSNRDTEAMLGGGGEFTGTLVLDSGELLGVIRGEITKRDRSVRRSLLAGTGAAR